MATQPSEELGNSILAGQAVDIESARASSGLASSQSGGAPEISEEEHNYRLLMLAAFKGDWESAEDILKRDPALRTAKITSKLGTVLHIAALSAQDQFFENLVELFPLNSEELEMVDCDGRTALHNAVLCGRIRMVKALVERHPKLTQLADKEGHVPLEISALEASMHKEITWFLAEKTTNEGPGHPFSSPNAIDTMIDLTCAGHHDITLYLVKRYPDFKTMKSTKRESVSILGTLARRGFHFRSGTRLSVLEALIYKCIPVDLNYTTKDKNSDPVLQSFTRSLWNAAEMAVPIIKRIHEVKLRHVAAVELTKQVCAAMSRMNATEITNFFRESDILFQATVVGLRDFLKLCIQSFPEFIELWLDHKRSTTSAVRCRQERILGLFLQVSSTNELSLVPGPTKEESDHMMYAAAESAVVKYYPSLDAVTNVAGAAFQIQRELQWYKKTCWNIFVEKHKDLFESGEKWAKDTSNSCMLVSTLIATVLFAAAFTVPGGNDDKTGVPLLLGKDTFLVFIISDVLGLFSSVMAILLFLAILTSRYEPKDFLEALPKKIIMGLSLLFLSLAFMLVAFVATLTMVLHKKVVEWAVIPVTLLASVPVALFVVLQLPLLYQMVKSTYGASIFHPESIWE